jgi:hypothetical protein
MIAQRSPSPQSAPASADSSFLPTLLESELIVSPLSSRLQGRITIFSAVLSPFSTLIVD